MKPVHDLPIECMISGDPLTGEGAYRFPHHRIDKYMFTLVFSSGMGWEHLSASLIKVDGKKIKPVERCPTWEDMCFLKNLFWEVDECCVQYHPPMSDYVSNQKWHLSIFKCIDTEMPLPPIIVDTSKKVENTIYSWLHEKYPKLDARELLDLAYYSNLENLDVSNPKAIIEFEKKVDLYMRSIS